MRGRLPRAIALILLAASALHAQRPPKPRLALVGGMLMTGLDEPPIHHAAVVIEGDRIVAAGPASRVRVPTDAAVIDTSGQTMLPGLIDLHVHLIILGHGDYDRWDPWIAENKLVERVMEISAKQLLMAGVTSAVDLGGTLKESLSVRDRIRRGEIPGPRMWMSGPWITRDPGDYSPALDTQLVVDTPEQAAQATERLARAGVDVIKAYVELRPAHYKAIVDTAHRHGIKVHAHVYDPEDMQSALDAGVDVLTHAGSAGTPPYEPALVRAIAVRGTPVVITAAHRIWIYPATVAFPERLQDARLKEDFPPELYKEVQDSLENFPRLKYFATTDRQMFYGRASLQQWLDAGAVMGMGTDSGTPMNFHTEALWREIKAHVDVGMPAQRAINAATRVNARILGREKDLGTVEAGKLADLIVVDGDPLFDVVALSRVDVVVKDGTVFKGKERVRRAESGPR